MEFRQCAVVGPRGMVIQWFEDNSCLFEKINTTEWVAYGSDTRYVGIFTPKMVGLRGNEFHEVLVLERITKAELIKLWGRVR